MTVADPAIQRELAMVKVPRKGENRVETLRLADAFRARVIDARPRASCSNPGATEKIEASSP